MRQGEPELCAMSYLQACRGRTEGFSPRRRRHFSGGVRVIPEQMPNGNPASTCSKSAADRLRKKGAKLRDFPHQEPPSRCLECARAPRKTGAPPKRPKCTQCSNAGRGQVVLWPPSSAFLC